MLHVSIFTYKCYLLPLLPNKDFISHILEQNDLNFESGAIQTLSWKFAAGLKNWESHSTERELYFDRIQIVSDGMGAIVWTINSAD